MPISAGRIGPRFAPGVPLAAIGAIVSQGAELVRQATPQRQRLRGLRGHCMKMVVSLPGGDSS